jgi:hypothetical protein
MKQRKRVQALIIVSLMCFAPAAAPAAEQPGLKTSGSVPQGTDTSDTPEDFYTRDDLGYWFSDFRWVGVDDWPLGVDAEDPSRAFTYAPVVLLLRYPKWEIQPYLGIFPYFTMSGGGIDLRPGDPGIVLGVSLFF